MANKVKFKLQGHEKFPLREGWLNKGLDAVSKDSTVFTRKDIPAPDILGIGNNMVKSLRYWLKAYELIIDNGSAGAELSPMGELIYKYDKYLEKNFTLWILHATISKSRELATSWYLFFNYCDASEISKEQIFGIMNRELQGISQGEKYSEKSLMTDIDVLLNMYSKTGGEVDPEEKNVSPFASLGLVKQNDGSWEKAHPDRRSVSEWEVLYELAVLMESKDQISIESAMNGENGIIKIFQISNVLANEYLDRLDAMGYINVSRTAGLDIIYRAKNFTNMTVVQDYYEMHR